MLHVQPPTSNRVHIHASQCTDRGTAEDGTAGAGRHGGVVQGGLEPAAAAAAAGFITHIYLTGTGSSSQ